MGNTLILVSYYQEIEFQRAEDGRMELVNCDGRTYFVPATEKESSRVISNFSHWEQAFRVFTDTTQSQEVDSHHANT